MSSSFSLKLPMNPGRAESLVSTFGLLITGRLELRNEMLTALSAGHSIWEDRYFVLTRRGLHYYERSRQGELARRDLFGKHEGSVAISDIAHIETSNLRPLELTLVTKGPGRNYTLRARTAENYERWVSTLKAGLSFGPSMDKLFHPSLSGHASLSGSFHNIPSLLDFRAPLRATHSTDNLTLVTLRQTPLGLTLLLERGEFPWGEEITLSVDMHRMRLDVPDHDELCLELEGGGHATLSLSSALSRAYSGSTVVAVDKPTMHSHIRVSWYATHATPPTQGSPHTARHARQSRQAPAISKPFAAAVPAPRASHVPSRPSPTQPKPSPRSTSLPLQPTPPSRQITLQMTPSVMLLAMCVALGSVLAPASMSEALERYPLPCAVAAFALFVALLFLLASVQQQTAPPPRPTEWQLSFSPADAPSSPLLQPSLSRDARVPSINESDELAADVLAGVAEADGDGEEEGDAEREGDLHMDALLANVCCEEHSVLHEAKLAMQDALDEIENPEVDLTLPSVLQAIEGGVLRVLSAMGSSMILVVKNDQANAHKAKSAAAARRAEGVPCHTLRQLLQAEVDAGLHVVSGAGPDGAETSAVLADPSAAMAVLWMRRSLHLTVSLMHRLIGIDEDDDGDGDVFPVAVSVPDALRGAYAQVLEPFHGWLVRRTFALVSSHAPSYEQMLVMLGPGLGEAERESVVRRDIQSFVDAGTPLVHALETLYAELRLEDTRRV